LSDLGVSPGPASLAEYAAIVWRRKLLVLPILICVPLIAVGALSFQKAQYAASADVLLRTNSLSSAASANQDPQRLLDTQARLARLPAVADDAIKSGHLKLSRGQFFARSSVSTDPNADILTLSGTGGSPQQAVQLANAYADAYTRYRAALDGQPITQALSTLAARLQELRKAGETGSSTIYASLLAQQRQLLALETVPTESAVVVARADAAPKTRPRLRVGLLVGLVVGLFLAIATALIREAVEKRPRSTEELPERLDLRVLGRIPTTYEGATGTVALTHPASVDAETYRLLRINFEHAAADGGKVFAVTSAIGREGKSTVAANLAVTLARAGRSVILIDCDPIRPVMRERFGLAPSAGLGELALGTATVSDVLSRVSLPAIGRVSELPDVSAPQRIGAHHDERPAKPARSQRGRFTARPKEISRQAGSLQVVTCNPTPLELADFIVTMRLEGALNQLKREADVVILDTAPLLTSLGVGVSGLADGIVVVANVFLMRRPILDQFSQALEELPVPKLGLVVTGVAVDTVAYGYYSDPEEAADSTPESYRAPVVAAALVEDTVVVDTVSPDPAEPGAEADGSSNGFAEVAGRGTA
jgi:capsular polysaccharide biosynthesis protein